MAPRTNQNGKAGRRSQILDRVIRDHGDQLRRQASKHSQRPENGDDALDDACLSFMRSYEGPPGVDAVRYMFAVVKLSAWAIDRRRRELEVSSAPLVFRADLKMDPLATLPDLGEEPGDRYERLEELRERAAPLAALKRDERIALVLLAAGYSYREIGERQGWTYTKVNRCVAEGRQHLGELVGEGEGP
jgi:RNA polymerase sigma factor (sigma-70 family)